MKYGVHLSASLTHDTEVREEVTLLLRHILLEPPPCLTRVT